MDADKKRIERARFWFRDRVPLNYQAVTYSAEDALDAFARFTIAAFEVAATEHTDHDAPCMACFWECEMDELMNAAEST